MNTPFTGTKQALPAKIDLILWTQQEKVTTPLRVSYFSNCSLNKKFGAKSYRKQCVLIVAWSRPLRIYLLTFFLIFNPRKRLTSERTNMIDLKIELLMQLVKGVDSLLRVLEKFCVQARPEFQIKVN